jgi:hypothetical protein
LDFHSLLLSQQPNKGVAEEEKITRSARMTTVVPTSEEDPALSVVRFTSELSWSDAGPEVSAF